MISPPTEAQINGANFDKPPCPVKTKLIICSTPRSGSYLLCRAMIHHGIGVPHEYFNAINASTIGPRFGVGKIASPELEIDGIARQAYIESLLAHRTVNGVFAAKIQGGSCTQYFKWALKIPFFQDAHFIYLYRNDLLGQAISFHVSMLTGRWGIDNTVATRVDPNPQFFDKALIENRLQALAVWDKEWRLLFARNGIMPLSLRYEDIKDDIPGALRKIVTYAKIELPSYEFDYSEPAPGEFREPSEPSKKEIRRWYLQANS